MHRQGYQCHHPTLPSEKLCKGLLIVAVEPLFLRYLFIHLGQEDLVKSWGPIRSIQGVSRLARFGVESAQVMVG
ncbi:transcription termination/antitermination NusG family protein [Denitratisoma sp. agr-D3]